MIVERVYKLFYRVVPSFTLIFFFFLFNFIPLLRLTVFFCSLRWILILSFFLFFFVVSLLRFKLYDRVWVYAWRRALLFEIWFYLFNIFFLCKSLLSFALSHMYPIGAPIFHLLEWLQTEIKCDMTTVWRDDDDTTPPLYHYIFQMMMMMHTSARCAHTQSCQYHTHTHNDTRTHAPEGNGEITIVCAI